MSDSSLRDHMRRIMSMRKITQEELINTYWQIAPKIAETGKLGFVVRGNINWESDSKEGIYNGALWLKSHSHDIIGRHISEEPVRSYLQMYLNLYEIWGTFQVNIDHKEAESTKEIIAQTIRKITTVTNIMSFQLGASLRWFPANYTLMKHIPAPPPPEFEPFESWDCVSLTRSQRERTSIVVNDNTIDNFIFPLYNTIESVPEILRQKIYTAVDWHSHANRFTSGLNSYLNYWSSIELLGNWFYDKLPYDDGIKLHKGQKRDAIMKRLELIDRRNCLANIIRCNDIIKPTTKIKIIAFLDNFNDGDKIAEELFSKDPELQMDLYEIRSQIAHGHISELDFEKIELYRNKLLDARRISQQIILSTIYNAEKIINKINS